ncbi:MFS transporter [Clostridium sp. 'deep sea']|uniref:MFS transporter n=1 Tax=Clostridium sp. 'deep sea' TaxID=2779445 RepID=UPI00189665C6|nr:glycoside-pentoside-hexuronide (GPH):cation symporter [Clostridium sp. 'deep sea']QOR35170.1 MFS transporter [Clostridium sp. 'deep sea']
MKNDQSMKKVTGFEIFRYGFGGFGVNLMYILVSSFIIYFLTDVAGVSVAMAGTMFLFSRVIDALFDPIIGALSDRTKSRWGRYRPFMMFGSIIGALIFILLFTVVNFDETGKNVYYFVVYCSWSIGYTLMVLPYQSIVSIVAKNKARRNLMVMSSKLLTVPAGLIAFNVFTIIGKMGGGAEAWQKLAIILSLLIVPSMWICASCARRFDTKEAAEKAMLKADGKKFSFKEQLKVVTTNKALLLLIIAFSTNNLADSSIKAVQSYFAKYVLGDMSFIAKVGNTGMMLSIVAMILVPLIAKKFAKKDIFIFGTVIHITYPIALLILNPATNLGLITILAILSSVGGMICNIAAFMMLPDCVDFGKKLTGLKSAGMVTSGFTFSLKASAAIGGTLASYALSIAGFKANVVQNSAVLTAIVLCIAIPAIGSDIASYFAMKKYPIDERTADFLE